MSSSVIHSMYCSRVKKGSIFLSSRAWIVINGDRVLLQHLLHHGSGVGPVFSGSLLHFLSAVGYVWKRVEHGQLYH